MEVVITAPSFGVTADAKEEGATGPVVKSESKTDISQEAVKSKLEEAAYAVSTDYDVKQANFNLSGWFQVLCEYMMTQETPFVRRQVRKLLLFICGTKTKYRYLRDLHALTTHMQAIKELCNEGQPAHLSMTSSSAATTSGLGELHLHAPNASPGFISMAYETRLALIEHLKACSEIASSRTDNWQKFCLANGGVVKFLITVSYQLDEGV